MPKIHLERAITVNLDSGEQVKLLAGGNDVTDEIADHWFTKAHMVKELDASESTKLTHRESELEAQVADLQQQLDVLSAAQHVVVDYAAMTVDQIKALLTEKGIAFNSRDTKAELIALLG